MGGKLTTQQKWRRLLAYLRRHFPPHMPVRVRSVPAKRLGNLNGSCAFDAECGKIGRFTIEINAQMSFTLRVGVLIHEWAHALTWFSAPNLDDHSEEWGCAYSRIYRAFCEWDWGKKVAEDGDCD